MTMRLDKAIEILNCHQIPLKTAQDHDFSDALKMGIGALKYVEYARNITAPFLLSPTPYPPLLPGETED